MNEACINEAIEDTTDGIYVLKQQTSDEPEDVDVVVVLKGFKGLVHPKMKIMSLITHPHVDPNPQDLHSSSKNKLRYFWFPPLGRQKVTRGEKNCQIKLLFLFSLHT